MLLERRKGERESKRGRERERGCLLYVAQSGIELQLRFLP